MYIYQWKSRTPACLKKGYDLSSPFVLVDPFRSEAHEQLMQFPLPADAKKNPR
jgi:hypothetical protein